MKRKAGVPSCMLYKEFLSSLSSSWSAHGSRALSFRHTGSRRVIPVDEDEPGEPKRFAWLFLLAVFRIFEYDRTLHLEECNGKSRYKRN